MPVEQLRLDLIIPEEKQPQPETPIEDILVKIDVRKPSPPNLTNALPHRTVRRRQSWQDAYKVNNPPHWTRN